MAYYTDEQLETMRATLKQAKETPDDPTSQEIFKRINEGKMNFELKALGLEPVEIKQPKIDIQAAIAQAKPVEAEEAPMTRMDQPRTEGLGPQLGSKAGRQESYEDLYETGEAITGQFKRAGEKTYDILNDDDFTLAQKFMGVLGAQAGGAAGAVGETIMGAGKALLSERAEQGIANIVRSAGESVSETEVAQRVVPAVADWYNGLDKDNKLIVDSVGGMAAVIGEVVGIGKAKKPVEQAARATIDAAKQGGEALQQGAETVARATGEFMDAATEGRRATQLATQQEKVDTAVSRILQAGDDARAVEQARRALTDVDTADITTYADLNQRFDDRITALSNQVNQELDAVPGQFTPDQFAKTTQVGEEIVTENPMLEAITGLEEAYTKSGEAVRAATVRQLRTKFETEGLSLREANDLAREYGIEFRDRAFSKLGEPKAGYNAENYENIRRGVKEVVREKMPDGTVRDLDRTMSDIYSTRDLTRKVSDRVAKLEQRITNRTLAQKAGGALASAVDLSTGGMLRGFVSRLLPSNMGNKAMNSIEIQKELRKNLAELDKLLAMKDDAKFADAFEEYVKNMPVGMSIKDVSDDMILENLMRLDPIDVDPIDTIRLGELKAIADKRALTENEMLEAKAIIENQEGPLPKPEEVDLSTQ